MRAVVLAHGAPAAFAEIGAPALPIFFPGGILRQALPLCRERGFRGILHGFLFLGSMGKAAVPRGKEPALAGSGRAGETAAAGRAGAIKAGFSPSTTSDRRRNSPSDQA